ncbi:MAG: DUF4129 domain-containing protein [Anaerolineae bacterium]
MTRNPWMDNLFRPLLIVAMVACIALSLVNLLRLFFPAWNGLTLMGSMVLAAVEGIYAYRVLRRLGWRGWARLRYRLAEWAVLIVVLKLISYGDFQPAAIWRDLQTTLQAPLNFFSLPFVVLLFLALLAWRAATDTLIDFESLYDPLEGRYYLAPPLDLLASRYFWGGAVLIVTTGLTRVGLSQLLNLSRPSVPGLILNVLVYFLLGLVLLSQARLTTLLSRWQRQQIEVSPALTQRWSRYALLVFGLMAAGAFLLPTGYSLGLLETVAALVGLLVNIGLFIWFLLTLPLLGLSWLFSQLFGGDVGGGRPFVPPPPPLGGAGAGPGGPGWWEVVRSLIFWALALAIGGYLIRAYLRDHPDLLAWLGRIGLLRALAGLLAGWWRWLRALVFGVVERLPRPVRLKKSGEAAARRRWRWPRLANLSPRERILYYYLSALERAGRQGIPRGKSQTPYEFEPDLGSAVPGVEHELGLLTEAFVQARYSRRTFDGAQVELVKISWQRVRAALRASGSHREDKAP